MAFTGANASSGDAVSVSKRESGALERLPGLDGVRAFAVGWVLLMHAGYVVVYPGWLKAFADRGVHGVTVFFVLSGFLITWLLLKEEERRGRFSLRDFYVRRGFRILPPVFGFLTGLAVLTALTSVEIPGLDWAACVFFFRNLIHGSYYTGHFWSLAIEEQFYLLWPLVLMWTPRRARLGVTAGLCLFAPVWRQIQMELYGGQNLNWGRADLTYDSLLIGALLAQAQAWPVFRRLLAGGEWKAYVSIVVGVALVVAAIVTPLPNPLTPVRIPTELAGIALVLKVFIEGRARWILRGFQWGPVEWIGRLSYSLYLWQQLFFPKEPLGEWQRLPWNLAGAIALAAASHYWLEQPALKWRKRFLSGSSASGGASVG